jgi:small-conductance mechanosensitive channel
MLLAGYLALRIATRMLIRAVGQGLRPQSRELIRKTVLYLGMAIVLVMVLNVAGVSVGALLGAAGVVGIAVGIASQTSLSNIISGLFLVSERYIEIGDVVRVGEQVGVVFSIELLSVKIKTFDNVLIRVPNQQLIEQNLINVTRFPIRRMDFFVTVPITHPAEAVQNALRDAASGVEEVLEEPEPFVMFNAFRDNGIETLLGVWFERDAYAAVRNATALAIQRVFQERGIEIRTSAISVAAVEQGRAAAIRNR